MDALFSPLIKCQANVIGIVMYYLDFFFKYQPWLDQHKSYIKLFLNFVLLLT